MTQKYRTALLLISSVTLKHKTEDLNAKSNALNAAADTSALNAANEKTPVADEIAPVMPSSVPDT